MEIPFFVLNKVAVKTIEAGARHSIVLDRKGQMYAFGDNSEDECAGNEQRCQFPEKIDQNFKAVDIFAGATHNLALSGIYSENKLLDEGYLYSWGGSGAYTTWSNPNSLHSKLKILENLNGKSISKVALGNMNTIVVTGGPIYKDEPSLISSNLAY